MTNIETHEQYKSRLAGYVEGKNPVVLQREALRTIEGLISGVPTEVLRQRPAKDKWSVTEIIAHLAEDELVSSWRYRQMLEHETPALLDFNQDVWASLGQYNAWSPEDAFAMFRLLREANLRMFERLTASQWERDGIHAERGLITVREHCRHMAAHDINHIEQIKRILVPLRGD
jgi:hypothetical protein